MRKIKKLISEDKVSSGKSIKTGVVIFVDIFIN